MSHKIDTEITEQEAHDLTTFLHYCGAMGHPSIWPTLARILPTRNVQSLRDSMLTRHTAMRLKGSELGKADKSIMRGAEHRISQLNQILETRGCGPKKD